MRRILRLAALACLLGLSAPARADLLISIGDTTILQGGTGFVDVMISSDKPLGDPLSHFGFEFLITPNSPRQLSFVSPQSDSQLNMSSYVFFNNSGDFVLGVPVGGVSSGSGGVNNVFIGGDDTDDGSNVTVTGSKLLARLNLTTLTGLPPIAGDSYQISLIVPTGNPNVTYFRDSNFGNVAFRSTPGTVTIGASTAIPEPGILATGALGAGLLALARLGRRGSRPAA